MNNFPFKNIKIYKKSLFLVPKHRLYINDVLSLPTTCSRAEIRIVNGADLIFTIFFFFKLQTKAASDLHASHFNFKFVLRLV